MMSIAIGGFCGAVARYLIYIAIEQYSRNKRWGTFLVNSAGSFLLGVSISSSEVWIIGFLGAFTTFSTFALDAVEEFQDGKMGPSSLYICSTLFAGLGLFSVGFIISH